MSEKEAKLEKDGAMKALLQKSISWEEAQERMDLELGIKPDPEARRLEGKIREAVVMYEMYCFEREVAAVQELLHLM